MADIDSLDDVDHCIVYYNQAVVNYHTRNFGKAHISRASGLVSNSFISRKSKIEK